MSANRAPQSDPLYVVALDAANARVIVGPREALTTRRILLRDMNWIGPGAFTDLPAEGLPVHARVRSTREPVPALLFATAEGAVVELADGEEGVSPGQACVLYESADPRARVLGGGFIRAAEPATIPASGDAGRPPLARSA